MRCILQEGVPQQLQNQQLLMEQNYLYLQGEDYGAEEMNKVSQGDRRVFFSGEEDEIQGGIEVVHSPAPLGSRV